MISIRTKPLLLAASVALLVACAAASAQTAKSDAERARELESARTELNRARVIAALEQCAGTQTRAATLLGISRRTLVNRLNEYGLARPRKSTVPERG